jgi:hypothetical protein
VGKIPVPRRDGAQRFSFAEFQEAFVFQPVPASFTILPFAFFICF